MFSSVAYSNDVEIWKNQNKTGKHMENQAAKLQTEKTGSINKWVKKRNFKKVEKMGKMDLSICIFLHLFCFFDLLFRFAFFLCYFAFFAFFQAKSKINAKKSKSKKQNKCKKMQMDKSIVSPFFPLCFPFFSPFWLSFFPLFFPFYFAFVFFRILLICFLLFPFFWHLSRFFSSLLILRISYSLVNIILVLPSCSTPALRNRGGWPNHAASVCTG